MNLSKCGILFEILATFIMFISYILGLIQSFINYNFKNYKTKEGIIERLFYEQFSYEIYSNINKYAFTKNGNSAYNYNYNYDYMNIELKTDSSYDCRGIYDEELNEDICQNKIINNYTCCRAECCMRLNGNTIKCNNYQFDSSTIPENNKILLYNDDEFFEDPRRRFCTYYNIYNGYIDHYSLTNSVRLYKMLYNYREVYLNNSNLMCIGKTTCNKLYSDCGIIDTKENHLYLENPTYCPITDIYNVGGDKYDFYNSNSHSIIIRNIISEIPPNIHEWSNNYINYETKEKLSNISNKDINKVIENNNYKEIYQEHVKNIKINYDNNIKYYFYHYPINENQKLNWYTTNYIGFESQKDLLTFLDNFDPSDNTNNPLYKIGKDLYPSTETIIIIFILIALCIVYFIIFLLTLLKNYEKLKKSLFWLFIVKQIILILSFGAALGVYIWITHKFKEIDIDIDENYKIILDLYNNRRLQLIFLIGLILLPIGEIFNILVWINAKKNAYQPVGINDNAYNSNNNILNNEININTNSNSNRIPFQESRNLRTSENRGLMENENEKENEANNNNNNVIQNTLTLSHAPANH